MIDITLAFVGFLKKVHSLGMMLSLLRKKAWTSPKLITITSTNEIISRKNL
jgi:hypothetical protein